MSVPFLIEQPFVVSFSGGRTSALMLRRILDAHGGKMPDQSKVIFCNTGKERSETLDFVERCSQQWDVEIVWLEYRVKDSKPFFEQVNYATASRNGEPFAALIQHRQYLPNPVVRMCTVELKIRTNSRYLKSLGWQSWNNAIGLRHDEPARVRRMLAKGNQENSREWPCCPLAAAGITLADVQAFWKQQPFDLALRPDEGNCDLCFLKGRDKLVGIMREHPELAQWWIDQETMIRHSAVARNASFRDNRPRYEVMLRQTQEQPLLPWEDEPLQECHCTD